MSAVLKFEQQLQTITCYKCGVVFAVPSYFKTKRLEDHETFWCPNGHTQGFMGDSEAEKLKKQLEQERDQHRQRLEFERNQTAAAKRELVAVKGQLTKTKKRVANGVCPCCHRSFVKDRKSVV